MTRTFRSHSRRALAVLAVAGLAVSACGDDGGSTSGADIEGVVEHYAAGVYSTYEASLASAVAMDEAVDAFVADPTDETLDAAKGAWLAARDDYGLTEAFRFYGGPIDDAENGPEGLINAWPLDEAYIDYVEGDDGAGIINDPETYPTIDADLLLSLNEKDGEANISTGWHAIEFLLWGQDLASDGPGERPVADFTTADHADRRGTYLSVASDQLIEHLQGLVDAWAPDTDNYRKQFVAQDPTESLRMIITGVGELSRGELAGERMNVAYTERSQEDEHSCFSDNTTNDLIANATGIQNVLIGTYPGGVTGPGILSLANETDAATLESQVTSSVAAVRAIPAPFDRHLVNGVADDDPGRIAILTAMDDLSEQTDTLVKVAKELGAEINVS